MKVLINGVQIHYQISGSDHAPVVVLSHSLASSMAMWQPQLEVLESDFQVLRYDMRGHGQSDASTGPYSLEMLAQDVVGLLDALGIQKAHFLGLSIGGMIGQSFALNYQDRLQSLVLCSTKSFSPDEAKPVLDERITAAQKNGMDDQVETTMERWFSPHFLQSGRPELEVIREEIARTSLAGFTGCLEAIKNLNYIESLHKIEVPTLIIAGEDDPAMPVAESEAMHERIEDSRLVVLPAARHLANIEQPESFNRELMNFFSSISGGRTTL